MRKPDQKDKFNDDLYTRVKRDLTYIHELHRDANKSLERFQEIEMIKAIRKLNVGKSQRPT